MRFLFGYLNSSSKDCNSQTARTRSLSSAVKTPFAGPSGPAFVTTRESSIERLTVGHYHRWLLATPENIGITDAVIARPEP